MKKLKIRVSLGTLEELGLVGDFKIVEKPMTAYLLQYSHSGCNGGCLFCLQSRTLHSRYSGIRLGRVTWPSLELGEMLSKWRGVFKRICLQTVIKPFFTTEALEIIEAIRNVDNKTPFSLAITPVSIDILRKAREIGVDTLGVGLDTFTEELFKKWRKPYSWSSYLRFAEKAISIYGRGNVYVHLIAGLGENFREAITLIKRLYYMGARVALFNYVNEKGYPTTRIEYYRLIQIARYLVENGVDPDEYIDYDTNKLIRRPQLDLVEAFYTSGCPDCNRPFYNESPSGTIYNIPSRRLLDLYKNKLRAELATIGVTI
ncbi:MAG: radical SAM protein [Desulfurococcaceae archaeon]